MNVLLVPVSVYPDFLPHYALILQLTVVVVTNYSSSSIYFKSTIETMWSCSPQTKPMTLWVPSYTKCRKWQRTSHGRNPPPPTAWSSCTRSTTRDWETARWRNTHTHILFTPLLLRRVQFVELLGHRVHRFTVSSPQHMNTYSHNQKALLIFPLLIWDISGQWKTI